MDMNRLDIPIREWSVQRTRIGLLDMSVTILNAALRPYKNSLRDGYFLVHHYHGTRTDRRAILDDETRVIAEAPTKDADVSSK